MIIKYLLLAAVVYVVYKYFDLAKQLGEGKSKPKIDSNPAPESDDFVDYEEIEE